MAVDVHNLDQPLSDEWLGAAGFKWHKMEQQGAKHWLLWLGRTLGEDHFTDVSDLGVEVAAGAYRGPDRDRGWFCWLRDDAAHRYHRFIHVRTLVTVRDLVTVIYGVTGHEWAPELCRYGMMLTPELVERYRRDDEEREKRLDRVFLREGRPWHETERDATRGAALPEHLRAAIEAGKAK